MYVCVCFCVGGGGWGGGGGGGGVHVYFEPVCSCFGMCSSFFPNVRRIQEQNLVPSQKDTPCGNCSHPAANDWVDLKCQTNMSYKLQAPLQTHTYMLTDR